MKGFMGGLAGIAVYPITALQSLYSPKLTVENTEFIVLNSGVGGNNTIDLLQRIDADCLEHHPALTVLMVGTNDMNSQKYVPIEQYRKNLELIIRKIRNVDSKVLLMTILPFYEPYLLTRHKAEFYLPQGVAARRKQLNSVITEVAHKTDVALLDLGKRFEAIGHIGTTDDSLLQNLANSGLTDGVHPTRNGYRFIALSVYDFIIYHNLPIDRIICFGDSITLGLDNGNSYPNDLKQLLKA